MRSDMEFWKKVRREFLTGQLSQREACRTYGLGWHTLKMTLEHDEPPGDRQSQPRTAAEHRLKGAQFGASAVGVVESDAVVSLEAAVSTAGRRGGGESGGPRPAARSGTEARRTEGRVRDVYAGIDQFVPRDHFTAAAVCDLLEVSRSRFYAWRSQPECQRTERDRELWPVILEVSAHYRRSDVDSLTSWRQSRPSLQSKLGHSIRKECPDACIRCATQRHSSSSSSACSTLQRSSAAVRSRVSDCTSSCSLSEVCGFVAAKYCAETDLFCSSSRAIAFST